MCVQNAYLIRCGYQLLIDGEICLQLLAQLKCCYNERAIAGYSFDRIDTAGRGTASNLNLSVDNINKKELQYC